MGDTTRIIASKDVSMRGMACALVLAMSSIWFETDENTHQSRVNFNAANNHDNSILVNRLELHRWRLNCNGVLGPSSIIAKEFLVTDLCQDFYSILVEAQDEDYQCWVIMLQIG